MTTAASPRRGSFEASSSQQRSGSGRRLCTDRCRELAERLVAAESTETARKRQKLEEETSERRRLEAELQKSQQESRELSNRLAAAEAQVSGKAAALQAAQSESAKSKERCEEPAARATAAESAVSEMRQQLRQLQEERGKCQEHCEELANRLKAEASKQAQVEVQRPGEGRSWQAVPTAEARNEAEAQEKAVLQERCEQLRQQLTKAEAERSGMLGQMQVLWEERGMYKERIRQLEHQLGEAQNQKQAPASHQSSGARSGHAPHCEAPVDEASSSQERDLAEQLGYSLVDDDGTSSSVLSCSSWLLLPGRCHLQDAELRHRLILDGQGPQERVAGCGRRRCHHPGGGQDAGDLRCQ